MLRTAHEDLQHLILESDAQELDLLHATQRYVRTITLLLWVPSVVAGMMAYLDCIYRTIFLPKTVFNMAAVRRGEAQPILIFKLFPFGELYDHFVMGYLGAWYALALGITTIPLWHTFIACLMKYVTLKLQILNKRVLAMDVSIYILYSICTTRPSLLRHLCRLDASSRISCNIIWVRMNASIGSCSSANTLSRSSWRYVISFSKSSISFAYLSWPTSSYFLCSSAFCSLLLLWA